MNGTASHHTIRLCHPSIDGYIWGFTLFNDARFLRTGVSGLLHWWNLDSRRHRRWQRCTPALSSAQSLKSIHHVDQRGSRISFKSSVKRKRKIKRKIENSKQNLKSEWRKNGGAQNSKQMRSHETGGKQIRQQFHVQLSMFIFSELFSRVFFFLCFSKCKNNIVKKNVRKLKKL